MVVKPPDECWVVRWIVGVVLNVQSTSAGCAEKGCLGRSGRRFERRFAMLGACRRASSAWSAWLASSVRAVAGPGANRCRVQKGGTPQGPASNDAISPVGRC